MKALLKSGFFLGLCLILSTSYAAPEAHGGWKLESERNGVKIYTRPVIGSKLKQVKAITIVQASKEAVMHVLTDYRNYKNWVNNITVSDVVEHANDQTDFVYTYEDAPWPVQNRYNVARMTVDEDEDSSKLSFKSVPNYMDETNKAIEIERFEGWWEVSALATGGCRIEYILDQNPGGYVPPWLVNYMAVDAPLKTMENLRDILQQMHKS